MLPQPLLASRPAIYSVTERHYYVREAALGLLMLWICYPIDILWLVALLTCHIPPDLLLVLSVSCTVRLLLSTDLPEPP